jgi:uncharacterized protein (TIGR02271 family)
MTQETLVAVYDSAAHADAAVSDLKAASVPANAISQHANTSTTSGTAAAEHKEGFWASLFGGSSDHDTTVYDRSMQSGSTLVSVKVPAAEYDRVSAILEKHNPIDLDERAAQYGSTETTTTRTTAAPSMAARGPAASATNGDTMQLAEETLSVGKRAVSGGTTRIRRYTVETPVEEQVTLHSEKVTLDRRPVTDGRTIGNADFSDKTIEMTETSEEAVVAKTARVKEEVSLRKDVADRVESVKDTVRRDEVEIEQVPGGETSGSRAAVKGPVMPASAESHTSKV